MILESGETAVSADVIEEESTPSSQSEWSLSTALSVSGKSGII